MIYKLIVVLSLMTSVLISCHKSETLQIGGSTTVLPVVSQIADIYGERYPDVRLMVNAGGSGVAINQVGEGKLQIGMISRYITEEEKARYPDVIFTRHVIGHDAVIPVVSRKIYEDGVEELRIEQIREIYMGEIANWSEVGGPDRDILVIDKERSRGTRHAFMQVIAGQAEAETPGTDIVLGANNEVQTAVAQSNSAIGMLSFAWLNRDVAGLSVITEKGDTIAPSQENFYNGHFPIIRDIELLTNGEPSGAVLEFIDFILSEEGQKIVEDVGYVRINQ